MTCTRVSAKASTPPCASGRIDRCALRAPRSSSRRRCGGALYAKEHDVGASRHASGAGARRARKRQICRSPSASVRARHRTPPDRNSVTGVQLSRSGDQRHSFAEKR